MSKRKIHWISIKQLKCHEFHTTLRKLGKESNTWRSRFAILTKLEKEAIKQFLQFGLQIVAAYLMLTSLRSANQLTVQVFSFEASLPASYFLAATSFLFLFTTISFCHMSVVMSLKAREHSKMLISGFSGNIYNLLSDPKGDLSLGLSLYSSFFVKELVPTSAFLGFSVLIGVFSLLLPLGAIAYFAFLQQLYLFFDLTVPAIEKVAILAGMVLLGMSVLYFALFHCPLPTKKNVGQIRWNFLYYLPFDGRHPQIDTWLKKSK